MEPRTVIHHDHKHFRSVTKFLEEQEEIEWATQAYKEYLDSGKKTYSLEEVKRMHDLD